MNLLIAVGTAVVLGFVTTRYSEYAYWRSWAPTGFVIGGLGLAGVYTLFGLIGFGIFAIVGSGGGAGAAAVHGGVGYGLLRVQGGRLGPSEGDDGSSRNALSFVRDWIVGFLEKRASIGVAQWTNERADGELSSTVLNLFHRRGEADTKLARRRLAGLKDAVRNLESPDQAVSADARGRLRGNCIQQIERGRLTKGEL